MRGTMPSADSSAVGGAFVVIVVVVVFVFVFLLLLLRLLPIVCFENENNVERPSVTAAASAHVSIEKSEIERSIERSIADSTCSLIRSFPS